MIEKLKKECYVMDEYGYTDEEVVSKVNEIIDVINTQSSETSIVRTPEEIAKLISKKIGCATCENITGKCTGLQPCNGYNRWLNWLTKKEVE